MTSNQNKRVRLVPQVLARQVKSASPLGAQLGEATSRIVGRECGMSSSHDPIQHPNTRTCQYPNLYKSEPFPRARPRSRAHTRDAHARRRARHQLTITTSRTAEGSSSTRGLKPANACNQWVSTTSLVSYAYASAPPTRVCTSSAPRGTDSGAPWVDRSPPGAPDVPTPPARTKVSWSLRAPQEFSPLSGASWAGVPRGTFRF